MRDKVPTSNAATNKAEPRRPGGAVVRRAMSAGEWAALGGAGLLVIAAGVIGLVGLLANDSAPTADAKPLAKRPGAQRGTRSLLDGPEVEFPEPPERPEPPRPEPAKPAESHPEPAKPAASSDTPPSEKPPEEKPAVAEAPPPPPPESDKPPSEKPPDRSEPADQEPTDAAAKALAVAAEPAVTEFARLPSIPLVMLPGTEQSATRLAVVKPSPEACAMILHGARADGDGLGDGKLLLVRETRGPRQQVIVRATGGAGAPAADFARFWLDDEELKFRWLRAGEPSQCKLLRGLGGAILEVRSELAPRFVALYDRLQLPKLRLKRVNLNLSCVVNFEEIEKSEGIDLGALRGAEYRLGAGKVYLDTGEVFGIEPPADESKVGAVAGLAEYLEVKEVGVGLSKVKPGAWEFKIVTARDGPDRDTLKEKDELVVKIAPYLRVARSPTADLSAKSRAVDRLGSLLGLKHVPELPSAKPEKNENRQEAHDRHIEDLKKYQNAVETKVVSPALEVIAECERMHREFDAKKRDVRLDVGVRLEHVKEASMILYRMVDDRIRAEDIVIGTP